MDELLAADESGEQAGEVVYYRPEREAQVLKRIIDRTEGPLDGGKRGTWSDERCRTRQRPPPVMDITHRRRALPYPTSPSARKNSAVIC